MDETIMKKQLPKFKSEKEEADFWSTHSPLDYPNEFVDVITKNGTHVSVTNILKLHYLLGWNIDKIQKEYPHLLKIKQVVAALKYYKEYTS